MRKFLLVAVLLSACAVVPVKPKAERLARLSPFDRDVVELDGELVRLTAIAQGNQVVPAIVALSDEDGKLAYTFVGPSSGYRLGELDDEILRALAQARAASPYHQPVEAKVGSGRVWCVLDRVPDGNGASPGHKLLLQIYDADPRAADPSAKPWVVVELEQPAGDAAKHGYLGIVDAPLAGAKGSLVTDVLPDGPADRAGIRQGDVIAAVGKAAVSTPDDLTMAIALLPPGARADVDVLRGAERLEKSVTFATRATSSNLLRHNGTVVQLAAAWLDPDGKLSAVSLPIMSPSFEALAQGKASRDLWGVEDAPTERILNEALVDWKNQELPRWLRRVTAAELAKAVNMTEKGILALDVSVRVLKDRIDAAARNNQDLPGAGEAEQLMEQRKMLLGVVLQAMKSAAAQKNLQGG